MFFPPMRTDHEWSNVNSSYFIRYEIIRRGKNA